MANATIRDVARRAEVSVASVSRALNGTDRVSDGIKARVDQAVRDLGFVPHAGARSLSLARTNAIGVMLPAMHGEFFSEIVRGMDREAVRQGYLILLSNLNAGTDSAHAALNAMRGRVDGLVVMAPHLAEDELVDAVPAGIKTILINSRGQAGGHGAVHIDNAFGVAAIVDHLADLGRKCIAYIAGPADNVDAQERTLAFVAATRRRGLDYHLLEGDFFEESGTRAVAALIAQGAHFDAVFAANDNMAIGACQALRAAGKDIPGDVAVAGFDDIPLARHLGITTVRVRIAELGERALARLVSALRGNDESGDEFHRPELIVRQTTGLAPRQRS